jgi:uncharacterized protein YceK
MSSDIRRFKLGAAATVLATLSCGTIQSMSHDSKDEWFPGVKHDLKSFGHTTTDESPTDPLSAACTAACLGVPVVIEGALLIVDLPFSFLADLVVMPFRTPVDSDGEKKKSEGAPAGEQEPALPGKGARLRDSRRLARAVVLGVLHPGAAARGRPGADRLFDAMVEEAVVVARDQLATTNERRSRTRALLDRPLQSETTRLQSPSRHADSDPAEDEWGRSSVPECPTDERPR